jgi:hypothetical protein
LKGLELQSHQTPQNYNPKILKSPKPKFQKTAISHKKVGSRKGRKMISRKGITMFSVICRIVAKLFITALLLPLHS